ncbi:MAG: signal peptide peptidase SppA [bacterium]
MDAKKIIPIILIVLCTLSLFVGFFNSMLNPQYREASTTVFDGKIALIRLEGIIEGSSADSDFFTKNYTAEAVRKNLKKAQEDITVRGILLKINSPGGTVAESQEIYQLIMETKKTKPVFVSMGDVAASGGYYIAAAADRIYACPGTLTGSIGVIFNAPDASELFSKKLGIKAQVIKSGKYKDIGSTSRAMTEDEKTLLSGIIQNSYGQFLDAITKGRIERTDSYKAPKTLLTSENLKTYADGRIFTGDQAKNLGFVDELGTMEDTYKALNQEISPRKKLPLVPYGKGSGLSEVFSNMQESITPFDLTKSMVPFSMKHSHKLLYIWE